MKVSNVILAVAVILLALGALVFFALQKNKLTNSAVDYKNLSYVLDSQTITLKGGVYEAPMASGSAITIKVQYFGNEAMGDLNADGQQDVAFLLTQQTGGSGTFYYLAAAINSGSGYKAVGNTIFLGDRIAPQTSQINNGIIIVNYADRNPGEAMTSTPTVAVSKSFKVENNFLVAQGSTAVTPSPWPTASTMPTSTPSGTSIPSPTPTIGVSPVPGSGVQFGTAIKFTVGQRVTFEDGLVMTLKSIGDSRCQSGVQCVWAGELNPKFTVSGGGVGSAKEFNFGTTTSTKIYASGYSFTLTSATTTTATVRVDKPNASTAGACYVGGCSSQICSDQPNAASTCEYQAKYGCYASATCARQTNGQCGWTQTPALQSCLAKY